LSWAGSTAHKSDRARTIPLLKMCGLMSPQAQFVSLQKDLRPGDAELMRERTDLAHFEDLLHDFADTAALIETMDLVITVDTAVAHLAGALGKEVWILLPFNADWRWMQDCDDSPWYPTARLFRQLALNDADRVIAQVSAALTERLSR
jgi:hypothetical protein